MILFVKLLLAHLLGDFLLQPTRWVVHKQQHKHKSVYLYLHVLLHGVLAFALVGNTEFLGPVIVLALLHGIIDYAKLRFQTATTQRRWFIADQMLHFLVIVGICAYWENGEMYFNYPTDAFWIVFTGAVLLTKPASITIKNLISTWTPDTTPDDQSLQNAGNYIGMLERLFVFAFLITGHFDAVGLLLGAKSIFRFGDLTGAKDRKLTEYVLIGTLLSFGIAMLTGAAANWLLSGLFL
ncbi:DUF3307 domain-containing protein [Flavobacterium selenitireducens]|uniref:DUF3307 domain-containing protein n=1 Tax=Flavobacterium selenitireducens TaxID=2722704 RepID=UPI00168A6E75|nr:DUF3307 domain-containing protein [Flavobacterium selenitireducens]MBD3581545.1 DUF3307 domain-containing protein [Flavobacterium selenitireducens]